MTSTAQRTGWTAVCAALFAAILFVASGTGLPAALSLGSFGVPSSTMALNAHDAVGAWDAAHQGRGRDGVDRRGGVDDDDTDSDDGSSDENRRGKSLSLTRTH